MICRIVVVDKKYLVFRYHIKLIVGWGKEQIHITDTGTVQEVDINGVAVVVAYNTSMNFWVMNTDTHRSVLIIESGGYYDL